MKKLKRMKMLMKLKMLLKLKEMLMPEIYSHYHKNLQTLMLENKFLDAECINTVTKTSSIEKFNKKDGNETVEEANRTHARKYNKTYFKYSVAYMLEQNHVRSDKTKC